MLVPPPDTLPMITKKSIRPSRRRIEWPRAAGVVLRMRVRVRKTTNSALGLFNTVTGSSPSVQKSTWGYKLYKTASLIVLLMSNVHVV